MDTFGRRPAVVAVCMLAVLAVGTPAGAVEYRMKVANIFDQATMSFLSRGELDDGATGPGFQRLAAQARIARGGVVSYWDEVRWDGRPGERSIWIVKPNGRESPQAVSHAVVGVNNQGVLADLVYNIVEQGPTPTTFEVVITWSNSNAQAPGGGGPVLGTV
jgi:hypothetical protein